MIAAGGGELGLDARDGGGRLEDTRVVTLVEDDVGGGQRGDRDAGLEAVDAAPDQALAGGGDGDGVVSAAGDVGEGLAFEASDHRGGQHDGFVLARAVADARFAVVVEAPGPDLAALVDGEGVVGPA